MTPFLIARSVAAIATVFLFSSSAYSADLPDKWPTIRLKKVASGFKQPTTITHAGDGSKRIFVVERPGTIRLIKDDKRVSKPFLDVTNRVKSQKPEQGLLGLAFAPDFKKTGLFYVDYTNKKNVGDTIIARYSVGTDGVAKASSEEVLLTIAQPYPNHNGGQVAFGPDGYLYIGMGDGGFRGDPHRNGQNKTVLLGKLLRIDVKKKPGYRVPSDNPFGNEIWAYGLRNPWRFSFDRQTGDLFIADVGQHKKEEVHVQPAASKGGENYGWNIMEGSICYNADTCNQEGLVKPVIEYGHDAGCSITGGFVHRTKAPSALAGIYFYADFCSGNLWGLRRIGDTWESKLLLESELRVSTFGEDEEGNILVADYSTGIIYRITATEDK